MDEEKYIDSSDLHPSIYTGLLCFTMKRLSIKTFYSLAVRLANAGSLLLVGHCLPSLAAPDSQSQLLSSGLLCILTESCSSSKETYVDPASEIYVDPASMRVISFAQPMDTTNTPALLTEAFDGAVWNFIFSTGSQLSWSDDRTLLISISWGRFPEQTDLRFTVSGLLDSSGTPVADAIDSFTGPAANRVSPVVEAGQTSCSYFDGAAWVTDGACAQVYTVGDADYPFGQDSHYTNVPVGRSYSGPTAHAVFTTDYTTTDNVTGLVWKTCNEGKTGAACAGVATTYTWYDSINACSGLNAANAGSGYAGRTNWRLPTIQELKSLSHYGVAAPSIEAAHFPATQAANHWTAITNVGSIANAWFVSFSTGGFSDATAKTSAMAVRCVSGNLPNARSLTDNGNGTITDNATGLLWQKCSMGQANDATCSGAVTTAAWAAAMSYCETLTLGGRSDWRLPSATELRGLVDETRYNPVVNSAFFPSTPASYYNTSTTSASGATSMVYITMSSGRMNANNKNNLYAVRCVTN